MSEYDRYKTTFFRIFDLPSYREASLIGTGFIAINRGNNSSVISVEGLGAAVTETPPVSTL